MNYESEFHEYLLTQLECRFGLKDRKTLYAYISLRYRLWKLGKTKDVYLKENRYWIDFFTEECNLPTGNGFLFKNEWFDKGFAIENSLLNVVDTWLFEGSLYFLTDEKDISYEMNDYVEQQWKRIYRYATNKSKPYKNQPSYPSYVLYFGISHLNDVFHVTPMNPSRFPHIEYPSDHDDFSRTIEEQGQAIVHAMEMVRTDTVSIQESDVEEYLRFHLELIEDGLRYIDHQHIVPDGRIDILAMDRKGVYVIIELKIVQDKELVWQSMYYPSQIKAKFHVPHVRMLTLAPSYAPSLLLPLKQLGFVETFVFTPLVKQGKLISLSIQPA